MDIFQALPLIVARQIFSNLSYAEITKLRLVNKWFNEECTRILNTHFVALKALLDYRMSVLMIDIEKLNNDEHCATQHISCACSCYKIFNILKSELNVLYAVCGRYVQLGVYCFSGGKLLDYFRKAMDIPFKLVADLDRPLQAYASTTMRLFLLNEEFLDHFENVIEPLILKHFSVSVYHGTKLVDLLDSYICSNYHIEATYNGNTCQICGRYEILDTHSISPPIKMPNNVANSADMLNLMRYFRNEVRWNNYIYILDSAYTSYLINKKLGRKRGKFSIISANDDIEIVDNQKAWSDENGETSGTGFDKTFSRRVGNTSENENVSYFIELECSKYCAPMRIAPYLLEASQRKEGKKVNERRSFSEMMRHISTYYEFSMGLKVILSSPNEKDWNNSTENSLNFYTDGDLCVVFQNTRELPL